MLSLTGLVLGGCSSTGGMGLFNPYQVASDDGCSDDKSKLQSYRSYFFTSMLEDAGSSVARVGGYLMAKLKAAGGDHKAARRSLHLDLTKENAEIDGATRAFRNLRACRLRAAASVKNDLAARRIGRDDARARLKKIHDWYVEDIDFADALGAKIRERSSEYTNASNELRLESSAQGSGGGAAEEGGALVANETARVRQEATTASQQIASLAPGQAVTALAQEGAPDGWTHVQLKDGRAGYVASRLLRSTAPSEDDSGIAQLTESQQLKRKALGDDIARAKAEVNGSAFELQGSISQETAPLKASRGA